MPTYHQGVFGQAGSVRPAKISGRLVGTQVHRIEDGLAAGLMLRVRANDPVKGDGPGQAHLAQVLRIRIGRIADALGDRVGRIQNPDDRLHDHPCDPLADALEEADDEEPFCRMIEN